MLVAQCIYCDYSSLFSQNHSIIRVGRDFWRLSNSTPSILFFSYPMLFLGLSMLEKGPFLCGLLAQGGGN